MRDSKGQFVKGHVPTESAWKKGHIPWHKGTKGLKPASPSSFKKGQHISPETEFKKGHVPWDKGKERPEIQNWLKDVQFQKGHISHNAGKPFLQIRGDKHWNWKGGVNPINDTIRRSFEHKQWSKDVLIRDNFECQICGTCGGDLRANHIKRFADYPELRFDLNNGITIHKECDFKWILGKEKEWESYFNFNLMVRRIL